MRINVYSQEITKEISLVKNLSENGIVHFGVRVFLASPDILHHTPEDDDRSAITFWIPEADSFAPEDLGEVFRRMHVLCRQADDEIKRLRQEEENFFNAKDSQG